MLIQERSFALELWGRKMQRKSHNLQEAQSCVTFTSESHVYMHRNVKTEAFVYTSKWGNGVWSKTREGAVLTQMVTEDISREEYCDSLKWWKPVRTAQEFPLELFDCISFYLWRKNKPSQSHLSFLSAWALGARQCVRHSAKAMPGSLSSLIISPYGYLLACYKVL